MRLTDTALRSLRPGQEVGEQDLRARANGDGTVSLFVRLPRDAGGKRPKLTLGRWPGTKLREARERVRTELAAAAKAPTRSASGPTLAEALDDYRRRQLCQRVRWQERYRELEKHLLPALGDRPLTGVSRRDLAALIDALPRRTSTNKLQTYVHTFFSSARDAVWRDSEHDGCATVTVKGSVAMG